MYKKINFSSSDLWSTMITVCTNSFNIQQLGIQQIKSVSLYFKNKRHYPRDLRNEDACDMLDEQIEFQIVIVIT
jgi:hypothetical protein